MSLNEKNRRISNLFTELDWYKIRHYSNDKALNEELSAQIKDIKLRVLKNGLDNTIKELKFYMKLN